MFLGGLFFMNLLPDNLRYPILFGLVCIAALILGFFAFSPSQALDVVRYGGYWIIALTFVLFLVSLIQYLRREWTRFRREDIDWVRWILTIVATVLLLIHEPHGFKVLMDEFVLAATSMSMHMNREVFTPLLTHNFDGAYIVMGGILDKRPFFFSFLLSVVHDLTGFRPENVFLLNGLLTFGLLSLVGGFCSRMVNWHAGRIAVILLAGLPLLALNATGGGFEILNLVMIMLAMTAAVSFLKERDAVSLNLLVLTGILLAQTRYESILYVVPIAVIIGWTWLKDRRIRLTWPVLISPLLLIPYPLVNSVFRAYKDFWQLPANIDSPFNLGFLGDNLSHAVAFFFSHSPLQSNSILLSLFGGAGLVFGLILLIRHAMARKALSPAEGVLAAFGAVVLVTFSVLMCYHWGQLDDFVVSRLSLPLYLLAALVAPLALADFKPGPRVWNGALLVAIVFALGFSVPSAARAFSTERFATYRENDWFRRFIIDHSDEGAFFIMPSSLPAVSYHQPAGSIAVLDFRARELKFHLDHGTYSGAYVFQILSEDRVTGELCLTEESYLNENEFVLELIEERKFTPAYRSRISRIVAINPRPEEEVEDNPFLMVRRQLKQMSEGDPEIDDWLSEFLFMLP